MLPSIKNQVCRVDQEDYDDDKSILSATTVCASSISLPFDIDTDISSRISDPTFATNGISLVTFDHTPVASGAASKSIRDRLFGCGQKSCFGSENKIPRLYLHAPHRDRMEYESPEFFTSEARRRRNNLNLVILEDGGSDRLLRQSSVSALRIPYVAGVSPLTIINVYISILTAKFLSSVASDLRGYLRAQSFCCCDPDSFIFYYLPMHPKYFSDSSFSTQ